jgi:hypothetical protein
LLLKVRIGGAGELVQFILGLLVLFLQQVGEQTQLLLLVLGKLIFRLDWLQILVFVNFVLEKLDKLRNAVLGGLNLEAVLLFWKNSGKILRGL